MGFRTLTCLGARSSSSTVVKDTTMSPPLPQWQPRRTLIDLYTEKDETSWYWRVAATFSAFLIMLGYVSSFPHGGSILTLSRFLILPQASQSRTSSATTSQPSVIAAIVILVIGYITSIVVASVCSSWVFQLDILHVPCLISSLLGLVNILYTVSTYGSPMQWTRFSIAGVTLSGVSTILYTIAALLTFRKIYIVRARDAMHRHQPKSSSNGMMPETELQRQQLLRLLLQQEDAKKAHPENNHHTFKLEWPGTSETRRHTMTTLRNLPRAARQAYENRTSASYAPQDPHPQAAMHMDPVTEEESLDPRMGSSQAQGYGSPDTYDEHNIPGIVNTRYPTPTRSQTSLPSLPQLQANGYPIEKPEASHTNEASPAERSMNQYHVVEGNDWHTHSEEALRSTNWADRELRRMEIELADRCRRRDEGRH